MFNKFLEFVRDIIKRMFNSDTIKSKLNTDVIMSSDMSEAINTWALMYQNKSPWIDNKTQSLGLAASIASEISRLVTMEFKSEITGSPRADYINKTYQKVVDISKDKIEKAAALGGIFIKPYLSDKKIIVEFVIADNVYPTITDDNDNIRGAAFIQRVQKGKQWFTRFEHHYFDNEGIYWIKNRAYQSNSIDNIGSEISLESVPEWESITADVSILDLVEPLFAYLKMPIANSIDSSSPLGISVYGRAVDLIKEADKQYSRLLWEFEGTELAIDADESMFKLNTETGRRILPKGKERLFRALSSADGKMFEVFSPTIRDTNIINGLNRILQRIEFSCGLAYGTLSDPASVEKTAEEIRASKQRSYALVCDIQKNMRVALEKLVYIIDVFCTLYKLAPTGKYEISFEFDDSIIADRNREYQEKKELVTMGVLKDWELRMWYNGETEEESKKMLGYDENGNKPLNNNLFGT